MSRRGVSSALLSAVGAVAAVAATISLSVGTASASLSLILTPTGGPPTTRVVGRTGGNGALPSGIEPLITYLVPKSKADMVSQPTDPSLIHVGQVQVDAAGNGHIAFVVPEITPGLYLVMVYCTACARFSAGRTMLPIGAFRVTSPPPNTATASRSPVLDVRGLGLVLTLIALTVLAHGADRASRRFSGNKKRG